MAWKLFKELEAFRPLSAYSTHDRMSRVALVTFSLWPFGCYNFDIPGMSLNVAHREPNNLNLPGHSEEAPCHHLVLDQGSHIQQSIMPCYPYHCIYSA